jgi:hypothetical protein
MKKKTISEFMGLDSCLFKSLGHTTLVTLLTISNSGPLALALIMTSNTTTTTTNKNNNYTRNLLPGSSVAHRKKILSFFDPISNRIVQKDMERRGPEYEPIALINQ